MSKGAGTEASPIEIDIDTASVVSDISLDSAAAIVKETTRTWTKNPSAPPVGAKRPQNPHLPREGAPELAPLGFDHRWVGHNTRKGRPGKRIKIYKPKEFHTKGLGFPLLDTDSVSSCSDIGVSVQCRPPFTKQETTPSNKVAIKRKPRAKHQIERLHFVRDPLQYRLIFAHQKHTEDGPEPGSSDWEPSAYYPEHYLSGYSSLDYLGGGKLCHCSCLDCSLWLAGPTTQSH
jgi:hypothetical protein